MQVHGKRKLYMLLFYSGLQPLLIWWMTAYLVPVSTTMSSAGMPSAEDIMAGGGGGGLGGAVPPLGDIPDPAAMP